MDQFAVLLSDTAISENKKQKVLPWETSSGILGALTLPSQAEDDFPTNDYFVKLMLDIIIVETHVTAKKDSQPK